MTDESSPKDLLHKWLIELITTFAVDFPPNGACDGSTSMWTQAALTSKSDLHYFYQRLDYFIDYMKETPNALIRLKTDIDAIYQKRTENKNSAPLTDDELKKVELRALAEAIAIQHEPEIIFSRYHQNMKTQLFPLTASKKNETQQVVFAHENLGVLIPTLEELEQYFNRIFPTLSKFSAQSKIAFHLNSFDHTVAIYLDSISKKWHFFDINMLDEENYHHEVNAHQLAYLIFNAFEEDLNKEKLEKYAPFSIRAISSNFCPKLLSNLKTITQCSLPINFHHRCTSQIITALTIACQDADLETTRFLLENGAKNCIDLSDNQGWTPLLLLIKNEHTAIAELLFEYDGASSIHIANLNNDTPLLLAAKDNKLIMLLLLLKHGASKSINTKNDQGNTPLSYACQNGHLEAVDELLQHGANPNSFNLQELGPLYFASQNGYTEIVKLLFEYGAQATLKNKDNSTALWIACQNGHKDIVRLLLKHNALGCIHLSDNKGVTPYMAAKSAGHHEIVTLLDNQNEATAKLLFSAQLSPADNLRKRKVENNVELNLDANTDNHKKLKSDKSVCPCVVM